MLVSAAVCPHPPLLVTGIGPELDDQLNALRDACWSAVDALRLGSPHVLIVVGPGPESAEDISGAGSFGAYGIERRVVLPGRSLEAPMGAEQREHAGMPLSLSVAAWLLERDGWDGSVAAASVGPRAGRDECVAMGERLAGRAERVALLVMADETPEQSTEDASGAPDADGSWFSRAVADGDARAILALDDPAPESPGRLGPQSLNPLLVLAGAAADSLFDAERYYEASPYGVEYTVAVWERHG